MDVFAFEEIHVLYKVTKCIVENFKRQVLYYKEQFCLMRESKAFDLILKKVNVKEQLPLRLVRGS